MQSPSEEESATEVGPLSELQLGPAVPCAGVGLGLAGGGAVSAEGGAVGGVAAAAVAVAVASAVAVPRAPGVRRVGLAAAASVAGTGSPSKGYQWSSAIGKPAGSGTCRLMC